MTIFLFKKKKRTMMKRTIEFVLLVEVVVKVQLMVQHAGDVRGLVNK
jgi:hypothetical protein